MSTINPVFANVGRASVRTFGVPVVYVRGPVSLGIRGIYDKNYVSVDPETGVPIQSTDPMLFVMAEDLPDGIAKKGDRVTVDENTYTVQARPPDSEGGIVLMLRKS